ncbi:hypothetical protein B1992_02335 [Pseudoxanthomonas broegbernensis]|uniref:DUF4380 domain-containing protein n=1 Tax=Pseudoxanthomonas broegbernensis TaxID=83619 RepID=A0A7V8GPC4_9GAMM|nr:DUF4380 domain-containing protein [Pseudoxanthomonas broegbernensis]KAF1687524.1 hypothetical protein B1992_02335 [Pseudoxanthomonas broegbernensis]MBB6064532.1 hypothetical protein [Pseudoxanthomonas broegbernensis]
MRAAPNLIAGLLAAWLLGLPAGAAAADAPARAALRSDVLELEAVPRLGGRVLHLSLRGAPNLIKVGEEAMASQPDPRVQAGGQNIPYLGHEVWVGPQADWWRFQTVNAARRKAGAQWPPDPWLAHAPTKVLAHDDARLVLEGAASPVSGVQLTQTFSIPPQRPDTVEMAVEMRNIRKQPVARDIWFNTRVPPHTRVYVPVAADGSGVRVRSDTEDGYDGLLSSTADGLFSLELPPPAEGLQGRRGKVFIQPRAGWMAGFAAGQAFLIHFEHQPLERIHPDQGQIELYLDWKPGQADTGLMELEVHGPYIALEPGATTTAREWWVVRSYDGPDRRDAQVAFLRRMLDEAGVE